MRKTLFMICLAAFAMMTVGCDSSKTKDGKESKPEEEQAFADEADFEFTELKKVQLPCSKDSLYYAWKCIGVVDLQRKKTLDYKQHTPPLRRTRSTSSHLSTKPRWDLPSHRTAQSSETA